MGTAAGAAKARESRQAQRVATFEALDDCRPLIAGIDTLHLSTKAELRTVTVAQLRGLQQEAVAVRKATKKGSQTADLPRWRANALGIDFEVQPWGTRKGNVLLRSEQMDVVLNPDGPKNFPRAYVELRAPLLWSGWANAGDLAEKLMRELTLDDVELETQVSRIDLACDFRGWTPDPELLEHVVGRVVRRELNFEWGDHERKAKKEAEGRRAPFARTHVQGRRFTGFTFGGGDLMCRLYDKSVEITRSGKKWFEPLWSAAGWEGQETHGNVWRLEFQLRREPLSNSEVTTDEAANEMKSWADVRKGLDPLWQYLTRRWLSYRLPRTGKERVRIHPRWRRLMGVTFAPNPDATLHRHHTRLALQRLTGAFAGYLKREVALYLDEQGRIPNEARFEADLLELVRFAVKHYETKREATMYEASRHQWKQTKAWRALFAGGPVAKA